MYDISKLRELTRCLDTDILKGVSERFDTYRKLHCPDKNEAAAWAEFDRPVGYEDFHALIGNRVCMDVIGDVVFRGLWRVDFAAWERELSGKLFDDAPLKEISVETDAKPFEYYTKNRSVPFPLSSDYRVAAMVELPNGMLRHATLSYHELSGKLTGGRHVSWVQTETMKPGDEGCSDPLFRQTPEGQPKVPDIIKRGMVIRLHGYGRAHLGGKRISGRYLVDQVNRHKHIAPERGGKVFELFQITLIEYERGSTFLQKGGFSGSVVAVDGKIVSFYEREKGFVEIVDETEYDIAALRREAKAAGEFIEAEDEECYCDDEAACGL